MKGMQKYKADEMHMMEMDSFKINALALLRFQNDCQISFFH